MPRPLTDHERLRGLFGALVERNPSAPWNDDARASAAVEQTRRNVILHTILTGENELRPMGGVA